AARSSRAGRGRHESGSAFWRACGEVNASRVKSGLSSKSRPPSGRRWDSAVGAERGRGKWTKRCPKPIYSRRLEEAHRRAGDPDGEESQGKRPRIRSARYRALAGAGGRRAEREAAHEPRLADTRGDDGQAVLYRGRSRGHRGSGVPVARGIARSAALSARPARDDVCEPALDDPAVFGVLDGRRVEPLLPRQSEGGADGDVDRFRSGNPSRL